MTDYSRHYAVLRVTQDTAWNALRARYRRLIGQWHPDRFQADARERELAEEQSKQITLAYQALERYYRDHGVLPPIEPPAIAGETVAPPPRGAETIVERARQGASAAKGRRPEAADPARLRSRHVLIVLSSIAMASYAVYRYSDQDAQAPAEAPAESRAEEAADPGSAGREAEPPVSAGITPGSTLGEVYAIQGIPTRTEGETWHYGKSSIRFVQGKVASWTQHPDNPLRIARDQPVQLREGVFDVGSTKDEVRSIQGTPVTETETVWDYGPSRVYFDHNRVVRWETSPLHPLRVPH